MLPRVPSTCAIRGFGLLNPARAQTGSTPWSTCAWHGEPSATAERRSGKKPMTLVPEEKRTGFRPAAMDTVEQLRIPGPLGYRIDLDKVTAKLEALLKSLAVDAGHSTARRPAGCATQPPRSRISRGSRSRRSR